jgi:isopenicillin-N epimerase
MRLVELPSSLVTSLEEARLLTSRIAEELGCEVAVTGWDGRAFIRLSAQVYNDPADYGRLAEGLPPLLRGRA